MKHLDLFSGIGGFALAAQWNGLETIALCEINEYCQRVLQRHWPGVPIIGDIREHDWEQWRRTSGDVFLLTGGFPCQPFSIAGKRRGSGDDRHLWPAMRDVIRDVRPTWCLCENVPGIINMELDAVLADLACLGYAAQPLVVPACAVEADHERGRVWIVAHADGAGLQKSWERRASEKAQGGFAFEPTIAGFPRREAYPDLLRKVHGIPRRMDRIAALGNSIVPQVAAEIIRCIVLAQQPVNNQ